MATSAEGNVLNEHIDETSLPRIGDGCISALYECSFPAVIFWRSADEDMLPDREAELLKKIGHGKAEDDRVG